jgi:hypothetical protein
MKITRSRFYKQITSILPQSRKFKPKSSNPNEINSNKNINTKRKKINFNLHNNTIKRINYL